MKIQWLVGDGEYDPAEFPPEAEYLGREEVGPGLWLHVVQETCFSLVYHPDTGPSVETSDGGWIEPSGEFRIVP